MPKPLKSRWWWFIAYPDSLPSNWKDILLLTGIPFIVSPLHNLDPDDNGGLKKEHYHVIVIFDNPTTYNHVLTHCCQPLNATIPNVILNLSGAIDYLTHKGLTHKAQYQTCDIECFNGSHVYLTDTEYINDVYSAIECIIFDENIRGFQELLLRCKDVPDAVSLIRSKPYYWRCLLRD